MDFDEEDFEVESSVLFRKAQGLEQARDLDDTLSRFGYASDDRIERRELVVIYDKVARAMEEDIYRRAHSSDYDGAKDARNRLNKLRAEFGSLQTSGVRKKKEDQCIEFDKSKNELMQALKQRHEKEEADLIANCRKQLEDQKYFQKIKTQNLEMELEELQAEHRPRMKASKRLIELLKSEAGLIRLHQYEEARKVRTMIDKILPGDVNDNFTGADDFRFCNRRGKGLCCQI